MSLLITGHRGFIGQALCNHLSREDYDVYESDLCEFDLANPPEAIVHLAGRRTGDDLYKSNVISTQIITDYCKANSVPLLFLSTAGVYATKADPHKESDTLKANDPYQETKIEAENIIQSTLGSNGKALIFRLFNPYGPGQNESFVIPEMVACAHQNRTLKLKTPLSVRDFIYIDDVIQGIKLGVEYLTSSPSGITVCNLCTGQGHSVETVARKVFELTGKNHPIECLAQSQSDVSIGDTTMLKKTLNWTPSLSLSDGLKKWVCNA